MKWGVFDTYEQADAAQAAIAVEKGLGKPGMVTSRWAEPRQTKDGKWAIPSDTGQAEPLWPGPPSP
jgi:hypothetical protein